MSAKDDVKLIPVRAADGVIDAVQLNDPIARGTSWQPILNGRAWLYTLEEPGEATNRLVLAGQWYYRLLFAGLGVVGLLALFVTLFAKVRGSAGENFAPGLLVSIGCLICCMWGFLFVLRPFVFDKQVGLFRRKHLPGPIDGLTGASVPDTPLANIHALQLLRESAYVPGLFVNEVSLPRYDSYYQLNLVLKDGERLSIIRSKDLENVVLAAKTIARLLDRPIWDAI